MNIKYLFVPGVVVADLATKRMEHYDIGNHNRNIPWWIFIALIPLMYAAYRKPKYRLPVAVCITGGIMNYLDALDGVVINPFIGIVQTKGAAFNMADIAILTGFIWAVVLAIKENKEKRKIGSAEWNNV